MVDISTIKIYNQFKGGVNMTREEFLKSKIKANYSVRAFSNLIGMPYPTLQSILKNVGGASIDNIIKICNGLGISPDDLANYNDTEVINFMPTKMDELTNKIKRLNSADLELIEKIVNRLDI